MNVLYYIYIYVNLTIVAPGSPHPPALAHDSALPRLDSRARGATPEASPGREDEAPSLSCGESKRDVRCHTYMLLYNVI